MSQYPEPADDGGLQLTYSSLLPGKRRRAPRAALPSDEGPAPGKPGPVHASQGAWPHLYHRILNLSFLAALFALGVLLGTVVSGSAASLRSSSLPATPSLHTPPTVPATGIGGMPVTAALLDAQFAIVTLGIQCLSDLCEGTQDVPAGQRVYAPRGDWSCTTLNVVRVTGHTVPYLYCRLDQPNVFTATFDGAPFDCVGARLGCHFVLRVETTNGR